MNSLILDQQIFYDIISLTILKHRNQHITLTTELRAYELNIYYLSVGKQIAQKST